MREIESYFCKGVQIAIQVLSASNLNPYLHFPHFPSSKHAVHFLSFILHLVTEVQTSFPETALKT